MDFDTAKENIQPLRQGRNVERLGIALNAESQEILQKELIQQRKEHELAIQNYHGDDPLELWYEYISWIEQSYPKSGKESHLDDALIKCISEFENVEKYRQDRRMIKIYMKYIDNQPNPQNLYQELYNQGIGTMVADLYIGWAYYYDAADNFKKTEEIYQKGLRARAQPLEDLEQAHKHFGFSMSQRILYKDEPNNQQLFRSSLEERRTALTSLRTHKKKHVGTTRTGMAVKSERPGPILQENVLSGSNNTGVSIFEEEEHDESKPKNESIVQSLVNSLRTRENTHEPGPWNKAKLGNKSSTLVVEPQQLGFKIMEDDTSFTPIPNTIKTYHLGFQRPTNFVAKNRPQHDNWDNVPLVIPEPIDPIGIPMYSKSYCYPGNGKEYSAEECHGYRWFKTRGISNKFTLQYDPIWDDAYECGIRIPPNFVFKNLKQNDSMEYLVPMQDTPESGSAVKYEKFKTVDNVTGRITDKSFEEAMAEKWKLNPKKYTDNIDMETDDLEETVIGDRRVSIMPRFSMMPGRQSVVSSERKSILPEKKSSLLAGSSILPEERLTGTFGLSRPSIENTNHEFKTPHVPGINRKSILPKKSILPQSINLSLIKDESTTSESQSETTEDNLLAAKNVPEVAPFSIFMDEQKTERGSLGAIRKNSLLKRKLDTPDKIISNKNVCAIDTPEKLNTIPTHTEVQQEDFNTFAVPKLPSPVQQKPFQIFEDDQPTDKLENKAQLFSQNDSMCTMNFNRCIETGSMSTPIKIKGNRETLVDVMEKTNISNTLSESPHDTNQQNISPINPVVDQENVEVATGFHMMAKQLSTIMETTETTSSTGLHTKSTIGSPESDNDTELNPQNNKCTADCNKFQEKTTANAKEVEESHSVPENSMAPPPTFSIFEDKTENLKVSSIKTFNCAEELNVVPAPVPTFSIFEDKTENMKAVSLHVPSFVVNDTEIINKENISRIILVENAPTLASLPVSNNSTFPAYDDDIYPDKKQEYKTVSSSTIGIEKESVQDVSVRINRMSIQPNKPIELSTVKNTVKDNSMLLFEQSVLHQNSFNALSPTKPDPIDIRTPSPFIKTDVIKRTSEDFFNSFCVSPVKTQPLRGNSVLDNNVQKPEDNKISTTVTSVNKKLISFEAFRDESQINPVAQQTAGSRDSADFYDLFTKSPTKPGKPVLQNKIIDDQGPKSPDISSLLKFDISNTRDTTQALVKINFHDSKNVSMVAKGEAPITTNESMIHLSQIKQETSLHITDRLSTFIKAPIFQSPDIPKLPQFKKAVFAEDDNINTMNFASNLGSVQNSTFIAPPDPDNQIFGIMKVEGGIEIKSPGIQNQSFDMDEDEFMKLASEKPTETKCVENECISSEQKKNEKMSKIPVPKRSILTGKSINSSETTNESPADDLGVSIYIPMQSHSVDLPEDYWDEVNENFDIHSEANQYLPSTIDLDGTRAFIHDQLTEEIINPFDKGLTNALLDQIDLINYLQALPTCSLRNKICPLAKGQTVEFGNETFDVLKAIGKGAYGTVFTGKCHSTGNLMALKQERPANLWEYYICLEIRSRIANPEILCGFMSVDYALIGTNASVLASEFSKHGTLIDVCNKIKKVTNRNMDEHIVMHLTNQILDLMDHLHSSLIIHADVKPDNFLIMARIDPNNLSRPTIQLIDFGVAIDMQLLSNMHPYREVQFKLVADEDPCIEMREHKYWTYQVDLYGVAGTAHAMLFGRYMEVQQKLTKWEIKTKIPRYFQKDIWEAFFDKLLNIRSCKEMPNLQELRALFKEELQNKDKIFKEKINEFNHILLTN